VVEDTLPFLNRHLAAVVRLQLLTGMRPAELCIIRTRDITPAAPSGFTVPCATRLYFLLGIR
jgi:hypothetical protein